MKTLIASFIEEAEKLLILTPGEKRYISPLIYQLKRLKNISNDTLFAHDGQALIRDISNYISLLNQSQPNEELLFSELLTISIKSILIIKKDFTQSPSNGSTLYG